MSLGRRRLHLLKRKVLRRSTRLSDQVVARRLIGLLLAFPSCDQHPDRLRAGGQVETLKKFDGGSNKHGAGPIKHAAKLENETEVFEHEHVSTELKKQIQQARLAKKMTQAQVRKNFCQVSQMCRQ